MATACMAPFDEILDFLYRFDWVHKFQVTRFFVDKVWTHIPPEWCAALLSLTEKQLAELPYTHLHDSETQADLPQSLQEFLALSSKLSLQRTSVTSCQVTVDKAQGRGMIPKKLHEVSNMAGVVMETVERSACDVIVDVGSGLGYLGQTLHTNYGVPVIGVEGSAGHTQAAEKRSLKQELQHECLQNITFNLENSRTHFEQFDDIISNTIKDLHPCSHMTKLRQCNQGNKLDNNSVTIVSETKSSGESDVRTGTSTKTQRKDAFSHSLNGHGDKDDLIKDINSSNSEQSTKCFRDVNNISVCMIGLHCCGDLTPTMLHCFLHMSKVRALCLVSCCYHKMSYHEETGQFSSFPLSTSCKQSYSQHQTLNSSWSLRPVSLRLAAQETRSRWRSQTTDDHALHTRHVAYRALLELFFTEEGRDLSRIDRKVIRKADFSNFEDYSTSIINNIGLDDDAAKGYRQCLLELHQRYRKYFDYIEVFTALQVIVQPVLESLVLSDRLAFLTEQGVTAELTPIFDENISPRNVALIANK